MCQSTGGGRSRQERDHDGREQYREQRRAVAGDLFVGDGGDTVDDPPPIANASPQEWPCT